MSLERRRFLKLGVLSVLGTGLAVTCARTGFTQESSAGRIQSSADLPIEAQQDPVFWFKPQTFKPYVGGYFEAPNARGQMISLRLVSMKTYKLPATASRVTSPISETESFSLTFEAASELPSFTSIHRIKHPSLGEFYLFLTPRKGEDGELFYEAVINHIP